MIIFWFYLLIKITNEELPRCNLALLPGCVCTWPSWEGRSNHHHWSRKIFFTAQYLPEESVLPPICAPRVAPDPELLPGLLICIGLKTCVGRLYFEAHFNTLAILICREGSFRIKLQTNCKHVSVPRTSYAWCIVYLGLKLFDKKVVNIALFTLSLPQLSINSNCY